MGLIPEDVIQQVIDRTNIVELIASYIPLKKTGGNYKALCPFHNEKTPSFVVTPHKQIFHCFGCHEGGNALGFVMKHERLGFAEAVRLLAGRAGVMIPESDPAVRVKDDLRQRIFQANEAVVEYYHRNLVAGKEPEVKLARDYLKSRSIDLDCVKRFRIGYAYDAWDGAAAELRQKGFSAEEILKSGLVVPREKSQGYYDRFRGRVIFPIFDYRDRALAFGARALKKDDKAKYINSPETVLYTKGQHLYGLNWAKDAIVREDAVIVVEGYMDLIRPVLAGIGNVVASLGTALTVDHVRLIRRYTRNIIMLFDMDTAGQAATLRSLDTLLEEDMNVRVAALADDEDPDSFILKDGAEAFRGRIKQAISLFDFKLSRLTAAHNAHTIEGRAVICQEMLPTIDKIPSEVVRDGYVRELASRLHIPEDAVAKERRRLGGMAVAARPRVEQDHLNSGRAVHQQVSGRKELSPEESLLLKLMLAEPKWVAEARAVILPEDLRDDVIRRIVAKVYEVFDKEKQVGVAALVNLFDDGAVRSIITRLAQDDLVLNDQKRMFADCVRSIKGFSRKAERQRLRDAMSAAEKAGDWDAVRGFQEQFNRIIKG
ncbi:MAG: DNA primase [Candidatus Omnitrophica bacterium]|nr:DNA primase [Candidatus Omnitrophota bacterium]